MKITTATLAAISGNPANANMQSVLLGLRKAGIGKGLERPHRLAHYLAQVAHESGGFKYDKEIWGPTNAQKRYEGRKDLGNIQPGDGWRFRGRGPIQVTGRFNYRAFTDWAKALDPAAPNFENDPDALNTDPWEGLSPIWYWDRHNLNRYADADDLYGITRWINGGLNGLNDRMERYVRAALVLSGYGPGDVRQFQTDARLKVDGVAGPATMKALHTWLEGQNPVTFGDASVAVPGASVGFWAGLMALLQSIFKGK